jgi:hypothetical protein
MYPGSAVRQSYSVPSSPIDCSKIPALPVIEMAWTGGMTIHHSTNRTRLCRDTFFQRIWSGCRVGPVLYSLRPLWLHPGSRHYHGGLTRNAVLPGMNGEICPMWCYFYCDGRSVPFALCRTVQSALVRAARLRADGLSCCCYTV